MQRALYTALIICNESYYNSGQQKPARALNQTESLGFYRTYNKDRGGGRERKKREGERGWRRKRAEERPAGRRLYVRPGVYHVRISSIQKTDDIMEATFLLSCGVLNLRPPSWETGKGVWRTSARGIGGGNGRSGQPGEGGGAPESLRRVHRQPQATNQQTTD